MLSSTRPNWESRRHEEEAMAPGSRWSGFRMVAMFVMLGILLVFNRGSAGAKKGSQHSAEKKLAYLAGRGPIITLADGNFTRYADGKTAVTRPYSLVVLFTALSPKYNCASCRMIEEPLLKVATAYSQQFDIQTVEQKVVFARLDVASGGTTFSNLGVQSVPRVFVVPTGMKFPTASRIDEFEVTKGLTRPDGKVDDFLRELGAITGAKVVLLPDTSGLLPAALLLGFFLGVAAHFFADVPSRVLAVVRYKGLSFLVSIGCFTTGVSGMIYCIIRNAKPYGLDRNTGAVVFFSEGGRDQHWYEGLVVALLYLAMSAAILGMYFAAGLKRAPSLVRTFVVLACVTVLCYSASMYLPLYLKKTRWYSCSEMLQTVNQFVDFHQGPIRRKDGLLRRLIRVSQIWLNHFPGFRAFGAKVKVILWDYIWRRIDGAFR